MSLIFSTHLGDSKPHITPDLGASDALFWPLQVHVVTHTHTHGRFTSTDYSYICENEGRQQTEEMIFQDAFI